MNRETQPVLLALDTSTRWVGVALYDGAQILCEHTWQSQDYHTVELAPLVQQALKRSAVQPADLAVISVAVGPGSFTGMRIGLALAKGMVLARHIPLVGVPSLDILAYAQPMQANLMAAVLRAGRGRLAVGWYRPVNNAWAMEGKVEVVTPLELTGRIGEQTWVCGELGAVERSTLAENPHVQLANAAQCVRRPASLAEIGWQRWQSGQLDEPASLSPVYLHYNDPIPD